MQDEARKIILQIHVSDIVVFAPDACGIWLDTHLFELGTNQHSNKKLTPSIFHLE